MTTNLVILASSTNLPLVSFAIARFESKLVRTELEGRRMRFFVALKAEGPSFEEIENSFNSDDWAPSRTYSDALRLLKGIVVRALETTERAK